MSAGLYILALAFSFWQPFFFRTPCDGWRNDRVRDESQPQCHWMTNPMLFRFKPNAFGRQTQCFWTSNPMLLDVKLNAVGTWWLHVFVTCCVLLSWLLSPAFPQSGFGWMRHSACWSKTRRARRLPPSPRSLMNGNVLPRKKSFFGGSVSCRRKVLFMCGSINYHRQVFWGGSLFTFCHLVCSFYIKQAAPQQFKQVWLHSVCSVFG